MKKIILCGEKISYNLFNKLRSVTNAELYDGYGPTETTIYSSMKLLKDKISVGIPTPNTEILIKDKKLRTLPIGVPGEVCISGDGVTDGYLNNNKLTKENFIEVNNKIWYKTGDLGIINFDIEANILDRIDFQIKINGQRVEVEEIEKAIYETKLVQECVVVLNNKSLSIRSSYFIANCKATSPP
jgi:non-ribosomal peptide synthetase component F